MQWGFDSIKELVKQVERRSPNSSSDYSLILRRCIALKSPALNLGRRAHQHMISGSHDRGIYLGNMLLHMYTACGGSSDEIDATFLRIRDPDTFSFNMKMLGYTRNGKISEAQRAFCEMNLGRNVVSWTILLTAFASNKHLLEASKLFYKMPMWNTVSQTAMIKLLSELGLPHRAREMFNQMQERNCYSWNTMIVAYAQSGHLEAAVMLLERAPEWDLVSWTTLLVAYAERSDLRNARKMFESIRFRSEAPWNAMIKAYAEARELHQAKLFFERIPMRDVITSTTMLDTYVLCGDLDSARELFDSMPEKNSVTWGVMISAYAGSESREALNLFLLMDLEGVPVEEMTFVVALDACASSAAIIPGRIIHRSIQERGLEQDLRIGSSLVNMYGKCGRVEAAREIFVRMPLRDVILWTSIIVSFAHNGFIAEALGMFSEMQLHGSSPDDVTLLSVLSACSHSGARGDEWLQILGRICGDYGLKLSNDHYVCVLDLLGRAGELEEFELVIRCMPYEPGIVAWTTLLSSAKEIGDQVYAVRAAEEIQILDPARGAPYTLLPNLLACLR